MDVQADAVAEAVDIAGVTARMGARRGMSQRLEVIQGHRLEVAARLADSHARQQPVKDGLALLPCGQHRVGRIAETPGARHVMVVAALGFGEDVKDNRLSQAHGHIGRAGVVGHARVAALGEDVAILAHGVGQDAAAGERFHIADGEEFAVGAHQIVAAHTAPLEILPHLTHHHAGQFARKPHLLDLAVVLGFARQGKERRVEFTHQVGV